MKRVRHKEQKIRFTEEEFKYVSAKMERSNIKKFQHFALMMLIQGEVNFVDYSELRKLVFEVKKIGSNINQVVRLANQFSEISATDIQQLTDALSQLTNLVETELHSQQELHEWKEED